MVTTKTLFVRARMAAILAEYNYPGKGCGQRIMARWCAWLERQTWTMALGK